MHTTYNMKRNGYQSYYGMHCTVLDLQSDEQMNNNNTNANVQR